MENTTEIKVANELKEIREQLKLLTDRQEEISSESARKSAEMECRLQEKLRVAIELEEKKEAQFETMKMELETIKGILIELDGKFEKITSKDVREPDSSSTVCSECAHIIRGHSYVCLDCSEARKLCEWCEKGHAWGHFLLRIPSCERDGDNGRAVDRIRQLHIGRTTLDASKPKLEKIFRFRDCVQCGSKDERCRYYCLICEDYGQCQDCEGESRHAGHFMMKMYLTSSWVDEQKIAEAKRILLERNQNTD